MFEFTNIFGKIAGILAFIAILIYILEILKNGVKPSRISWWIWTVAGIVTGASYYASGANHTLWIPLVDVIGPLIIALLSFKYGEGGSTKFDWVCLSGAGIGIILWIIFNSPVLALLFYIFIDLFAIIPTIKKSYSAPEKEGRIGWTIRFISCIFNFFAIEHWTIGVAVYPIYMLIASGIITVLLYRKMIWKRQQISH